IQADAQLAKLMQFVLTTGGLEVINVSEADPDVVHQQPDIIVINTNLGLPEKRACIDALRAIAPRVSIVDLSLGADSPAYDSGADGYLGKPFEAQDLIDRVRDVDSWSR